MENRINARIVNLKKIKSLKMKTIKKILCCIMLSIVFINCYKEHKTETKIGETGSPKTKIGWHTVVIEQEITAEDMERIGICYSEDETEPTIQDSTVPLANNIATLSNLKENTRYYWRIFMKRTDVLYGETNSFTTRIKPVVETEKINVSTNSATLRGKIIKGYDSTDTTWMRYWDLENERDSVPCYGDSVFNTTLGNLTPQTQYFAQACIINIVGEKVEGNVVSFETFKQECPTVVTLGYSIIDSCTVILCGAITDLGESGYYEKGIVFYFNMNAYTFRAVSEGNFDPGKFCHEETNITKDTCYYQAYAKCLPDTIIYGECKKFTMPSK